MFAWLSISVTIDIQRFDNYSSGNNYDHRKQWIVSRLKFISYVFSIEICAYAVMSNHKIDWISFERHLRA